ncbi:MAG TPA: diguanylate cyclase [Candidatus Limenecus avicola]|uniref:Diguanylate cyclase n=1 Tax=Candidatus Limenecus avicola TaxID=2840847 RepID=A0A9D1SR15_9CLOT|nr:diguanylate cyclase [Candidatus Limenecus avicola]
MNFNNYKNIGNTNKNQSDTEKTGVESKHSNPIIPSGLISKINTINNRTTANRMYAGYNQKAWRTSENIDYHEVIKFINEVTYNKDNKNELFYSLHNIFVNKLNASFSAFGLYCEQSNCINFKIIDKIGSTFTSRILLNGSDNPVEKAFASRTTQFTDSNKFLNVHYLSESGVAIVPLIAINQCIGVMLVGDDNYEASSDIYKLMANYLALFIQNKDLSAKVLMNTDTDALTGLNNHRKFQEKLASEIDKAQRTQTQTSIVIFDINNISQINKDFGAAKGDEIIKLVADKIKQGIRSNDSAARYGGDEVAIILPETNSAEAKYLAEYLTYSLSCCLVDDVGPIKVSVGIATYPNSTKDLEKLLILAEQAMFISKSKGYKNGMSTIVCSDDFDFWDDTALSSFASVIAKRHASIGINFDEELVNKFHSEEIINQGHLIEVVTSLASAIDAKDEYTKGHSSSVSRYSEALARALNLPEKDVERIKLGALLHDIGKIGIPENVLKKPSKLTDEEWEIMKQHPTIGAEKVLMPNESLHDLIPIVKYHHEHWDGSGYPEKLKGEDIPLAARIVSVADAYHALISDRPYRKGMSNEKACEILKVGAGIQWDKNLVREFINISESLYTKI